MNHAGIYHRPESEFAYLYTKDVMRIRLQTTRAEIESVGLISGDFYTFAKEKWYQEQQPMKKAYTTEFHDYWEIEVTAPHRRLAYGFCLTDPKGEQAFYNDQGVFDYTLERLSQDNLYFRMPYFQEIDRCKVPDWVAETVWYQIFPERFYNGDPTNDPADVLAWGSQKPTRENFFGGDLQGIIDKLDYLADLGVNGLYLCPIFTSPSNHKYDTIDYYEIDAHFGDKQIFRELVEKAHQRGMRIMLDAVFNRLGASSPQWQDVLLQGEASQYADWFHIDSFPPRYTAIPGSENAKDLTYDTFNFNPNMPKLNTANPEVQAYLLAIATYWIREFDIDGWRLDVANEVDHHFWKKFHTAVLQEKADLYILGEIWHSAQRWLEGDEFHGVMNYAFTDSIKDFFIEQSISISQMIAKMNRQQLLYRDQTNEVSFNLLDSHDTPRILTLCQGNRDLAKAVLTFMFIQKGTPCIYYGTEVAMEGEMDPDCRRCMIWDEQDEEFKTFVKALIALRKQFSDVFSYGTLIWEYDDQQKIFSLTRSYRGKTLIATFNEGQPTRVEKSGCRLFGQNIYEDTDYQLLSHGFVIEES
ncbi:glycoside hydrolase family 13 protein [Enterococcus pseudoavium]|uniref:Glycoside hydrolase family 13 protein n=1 Tax=Enterococcus pseudoavium TaxID=44007 RepID=A0AAE4I0I6_9ENTE|nr:glycoside hydrolase family 13 protein [Enterococcus pseudoavium]MDT2735825.1 glycoside hydrolase family 13 protein [Enterococcus pseudoavium]MDT2754377.1 glycoside hydrolase family 13 protein [Enterococcus pseudoavium]MDT2769568.1 glycoside hydrolase family 13 protein [Enterococcus pseudoavium]